MIPRPPRPLFRNGLRRLNWPVRSRISGLAVDIMARLGPRDTMLGVELCTQPEEDGTAEVFLARMRLALALIEKYDQRRMRRIRRDLRRILLVADGGGRYNPPSRTYFVSWPTFMFTPVEEHACSIVHEATHARLCRRGIQYSRELRRRIETLCVREEIAFADKLPSGDWTRPTLDKLAMPWWSDADLHLRNLQLLRASRIPTWIVGLFDRRYRRWRGSQSGGAQTD